MKKILLFSTLLIGSLFTARVYANHYSEVELNLPFLQAVCAQLDGREFEANSTGYLNPMVMPGYHRLTITSAGISPRYGHSGRRVIYDGDVYVEAGSHVKLCLDSYNHLRVDAYPLQRINEWDTYGQEGAHGHGHAYGHQCHQGNYSGYGYNQILPVAPGQFMIFRNAVANAWFDQDKVAMITNYLATHYITTAQAAELISLCDFEHSKLDIAKAAFLKTVDMENYFSVINLFSFESSKRNLSDFIALHS